MFNFDGQLVADALFIQRMGDTLQGIRDHRAAMRAVDLQEDLLSVIGRYNQLHARFNGLVGRYNDVLADNKRVDASHSQALAEKDRQIAQLVAEKEEFRLIGSETCDKLSIALDEIRRLKLKAGELSPDERRPGDP